ncbi:hypothetical protein CEXT_485281 [Caerostris extrusa]|uniref:Uncharacterized protein n=1 Tax=Caerostris extrusa TaxID=172846 RepID=A0AAV4XUV2_CAEEX|nr:hypothetical protein CEXT_485281 [Caerostris extrusa]
MSATKERKAMKRLNAQLRPRNGSFSPPTPPPSHPLNQAFFSTDIGEHLPGGWRAVSYVLSAHHPKVHRVHFPAPLGLTRTSEVHKHECENSLTHLLKILTNFASTASNTNFIFLDG